MIPVALLLAALLVTALLCGGYIGLARRRQWLDHPNHRSSHQRPTPHGGGVVIIVVLLASALVSPLPWPPVLQCLLALALLLMLLGVLDDRVDLPVKWRFAVYALSCVVAAGLLLAPWGPVALLWLLPVSLGMLWLLNLYNFMDGIDGLAALQCMAAAGAAAWLASAAGEPEYVLICLLLAVCHLGFLVWNRPPAKLFMGDAGSIPSGFLLGALAVYAQVSGVLSAAVWPILLAGFVVDATWTLLRRWRRGDNVAQAHREHLYQRLSRHWDSHLKVDVAFLSLFLFWLLPMAWVAQTFQHYALFPLFFAYLPLLFCMAKTAHLP